MSDNTRDGITFTIRNEERQRSCFDTGGETPTEIAGEINGRPVRALGFGLTAQQARGFISSESDDDVLFAVFVYQVGSGEQP